MCRGSGLFDNRLVKMSKFGVWQMAHLIPLLYGTREAVFCIESLQLLIITLTDNKELHVAGTMVKEAIHLCSAIYP